MFVCITRDYCNCRYNWADDSLVNSNLVWVWVEYTIYNLSFSVGRWDFQVCLSPRLGLNVLKRSHCTERYLFSVWLMLLASQNIRIRQIINIHIVGRFRINNDVVHGNFVFEIFLYNLLLRKYLLFCIGLLPKNDVIYSHQSFVLLFVVFFSATSSIDVGLWQSR